MKCPSCGNTEAYIGFSDIDCPNNQCKHFQGSAVADPVSPPPTPTLSPNIFGGGGGGWGPWGGAPTIAAPNLTIRVSSVSPRQNNVQVSFIAGGDPGNFYDVEIYFDIGQGDQLCTLSHPNATHIPGVNADGITVHTTNWLCLQDGVKPTDNYQLRAVIV